MKQPSTLNKTLLSIAFSLPLIVLAYQDNANPITLFMIFVLMVAQIITTNSISHLTKAIGNLADLLNNHSTVLNQHTPVIENNVYSIKSINETNISLILRILELEKQLQIKSTAQKKQTIEDNLNLPKTETTQNEPITETSMSKDTR